MKPFTELLIQVGMVLLLLFSTTAFAIYLYNFGKQELITKVNLEQTIQQIVKQQLQRGEN